METKIISYTPTGAFNAKHRPESRFYKEVTLFDLGVIDQGETMLKEALIMRFYRTSTRTFCVAWPNTDGTKHECGTAVASGVGFNRENLSVMLACKASGMVFDNPKGLELSPIEVARSFAKFLNLKNFAIKEAHA